MLMLMAVDVAAAAVAVLEVVDIVMLLMSDIVIAMELVLIDASLVDCIQKNITKDRGELSIIPTRMNGGWEVRV